MISPDQLRPAAGQAPVSGIEAVANYARGKSGIIPLWAGESDIVTPDFISAAAKKGLDAGETFYTWQDGIPELRQALARYYSRHFPGSYGENDFVVTIGGMHAMILSLQATVGAGDEAIYLSPAWPNFATAAAIAGAVPVPVGLELTDNGWTCDVGRIEAAITPRTKAIFVNTPSNPTGWAADKETLAAILEVARRHGLWIIADEIYARFHYDGGRAASFLDVADPDDRILYVNSFSKNWAMTGWRVGWLKLPASLSRTFANLVQYSSSGVAAFLQRGAVAALDDGDPFVEEQIARARKARDIVCAALGDTGRTRFAVPAGAFYLFFAVDGLKDSTQAAFDIVDRARVSLAPGVSFGADGEGFLRLCFHRRLDEIEQAAERLSDWISKR